MDRTITAVFDTEAEAMRAQDALVSHGFARDRLRLHRHAADPVEEKGFWESLADLFIPEDDRHGYAEAARRGGLVLSLSVPAAQAEAAADILEANGAVDLDERAATWRAEGWGGLGFDTYGEDSVLRSGRVDPPGTELSRATDDVLGTNISGARPENDRTNPPGTMLSRAADDVLGTNMSGARPENDIANPPGTKLSRATDDALGTNVSGARPQNDIVNPPGTELSRATDDALGTNISGARPENDRSNPPGTELSRAADDVLGTNMSGARPENERNDPPGTMLSRAADDVLGTNMSGARPENDVPSWRRDEGWNRARVRSYAPYSDPFNDRLVTASEAEEDAQLARELREREQRLGADTARGTAEAYRDGLPRRS